MATHYEMLWDCAQCGTPKLLGKTHRYCPSCGNAQDPESRYFPAPGEEIEAKDHQYFGRDWFCEYCQTPNSAAAKCCVNCGANADGTKPVALVQDQEAAPVESLQPDDHGGTAGKPSRSWLRYAAGLFGVLLLALGVAFFSTTEAVGEVVDAQWARTIDIERFSPVSQSAWCDEMPSDAYSITRSREVRDYREIPDGQSCHTVRQDAGDGTFTQNQVCETTYRSEPIHDDKCHYTVMRWGQYRSAKASGRHGTPLSWPETGLPQHAGAWGARLGDERERSRSEIFTLLLKVNGRSASCAIARPLWETLAPGSSVHLKVRRIGGVVCDSVIAQRS